MISEIYAIIWDSTPTGLAGLLILYILQCPLYSLDNKIIVPISLSFLFGVVLSVFSPISVSDIIISIQQQRKLRHREVKNLAQGHRANK